MNYMAKSLGLGIDSTLKNYLPPTYFSPNSLSRSRGLVQLSSCSAQREKCGS